MTTNRVNFVDEDDARSVLFALFKQVAYSAGAHANKHFYEVRARNRKERNIGFASYCTSQQGLTSSRRSDQQDALGNTSTELLELLRFAQEFDNLAQLFLGFIHAGDVLKCHLFLLHGEQAGATLAK